MLNTMEWTSTWTEKSKMITTASVAIPLEYIQKISNRTTRAKARTTSNADTLSFLIVTDNQTIDITSTIGVFLDLPDLVSQLYIFRDPIAIRTFLDCYPFLVPILLEAVPHLEKYFSGQKIFLEVISDPEAVDTGQLVAIIVETSSPDEAFDRLERFDSAWWVGAVSRAKGKLCIDVEFA